MNEIESKLENLSTKELSSLQDILNSNEYNYIEKMVMDELIENELAYNKLKNHVYGLIDGLDNGNEEKPKFGMTKPKKISPMYITVTY